MQQVTQPTEPVSTEPTQPTDGGGTTPTTPTSGGGTTTTTTTTATGLLDTLHGQGVEIRIYDPSGKRRRLPALNIAEAHWTIEPTGGFADFSLTLHCQPDELTTIVADDMVEIWDFGIRQFRGYVGDLTRSEDEPPTLTIAGYGRVIDLERMVLQGAYQRANDTDISDLFAEIAADVQTRYPDIVVQVDSIGVATQVIDGRQKTAKEIIDALIGLASSVAVWGLDVDDAGRDRLYLRKINTNVVDASIAIPGANVGHRECATHVSDVVNCVTVVGGTAQFPQLLPNGSFETLTKPGGDGDGSTGESLLRNGSFESGEDNWSFQNGADYKVNGGQEPPARTGSSSAELDHVGEKITQQSDSPPVAIVAGHSYEVGAWLRPEYSANFNSPPTLTLRFYWRSGGSDQSSVTWSYIVTEAAYRLSSQTVVAPAGATGFRFEVELTYVDQGGNNHGVMVDDCYAIDASSLVATQWQAVQHGSATVNAANWQARGAYDGRNCLYLDVNSSDSDGQDVHVRIVPTLENKIVGGQTVRLAARIKSAAGAATPMLLLVQQFRKDDGNTTGGNVGTEYRSTVASATRSGWTYVSYDAVAPGDATQVECWLNIRATGKIYIDAISARVVPDQGDEDIFDTTYLPAGNLQVRYRADDLVSAAANAEVNGSITTYGLREKVENSGDLTTLTDAKAWATSYLLANALAYPAPVIDLFDDRRAWAIGKVIRLTGAYGAAYANRPLPLLRINGSIDGAGLMAHQLEIGKLRATDEELIARLSLKNAYKALSA